MDLLSTRSPMPLTQPVKEEQQPVGAKLLDNYVRNADHYEAEDVTPEFLARHTYAKEGAASGLDFDSWSKQNGVSDFLTNAQTTVAKKREQAAWDAAQPETRGFLAGTGAALGRGAMNVVGSMGHTLALADATPNAINTDKGILDRAGEGMTTWAEDKKEKTQFMRPTMEEEKGETGAVKKAWEGGVESMVTSTAPMVAGLAGAKAGGALGAPLGPAGAAIGATIGGLGAYGLARFGMFGAGVYGDTYDKTYAELKQKNPGMGEDEVRRIANKGAWTDAISENVSEAVGDAAAFYTFGGSKVLQQPLTATIKDVMKRGLKGYATDVAKQMPFEVGSEMANAAVGANWRQEAGLQGGDMAEAAKEASGPAIVMSLLMGGGVAGYTEVKARKALANINGADPDVRARTANEIALQIKDRTGEEDLAESWRQYAFERIGRGEEIELDEQLMKFGANRARIDAADAGQDIPVVTDETEQEQVQAAEPVTPAESLLTGGVKQRPEDVLLGTDPIIPEPFNPAAQSPVIEQQRQAFDAAYAQEGVEETPHVEEIAPVEAQAEAAQMPQTEDVPPFLRGMSAEEQAQDLRRRIANIEANDKRTRTQSENLGLFNRLLRNVEGVQPEEQQVDAAEQMQASPMAQAAEPQDLDAEWADREAAQQFDAEMRTRRAAMQAEAERARTRVKNLESIPGKLNEKQMRNLDAERRKLMDAQAELDTMDRQGMTGMADEAEARGVEEFGPASVADKQLATTAVADTQVANISDNADLPSAGTVTAPAQAEASKKEPWQMTREERKRQLDGRTQEDIDNYDPSASVVKVRGYWYVDKTIPVAGVDGSGKGLPSGFKTKREAIETAKRHKELVQDMLNNPLAYGELESAEARHHLDELGRLMPLGMTELDAAKLLTPSHKEAVKQALSEGKPVPPEVLAGYPDLAQSEKKTSNGQDKKPVVRAEESPQKDAAKQADARPFEVAKNDTDAKSDAATVARERASARRVFIDSYEDKQARIMAGNISMADIGMLKANFRHGVLTDTKLFVKVLNAASEAGVITREERNDMSMEILRYVKDLKKSTPKDSAHADRLKRLVAIGSTGRKFVNELFDIAKEGNLTADQREKLGAEAMDAIVAEQIARDNAKPSPEWVQVNRDKTVEADIPEAQKEKLTLKQQKAWLLAEIAKVEEAGVKDGKPYEFHVPGDGHFRVKPEQLAAFKERIIAKFPEKSQPSALGKNPPRPVQNPKGRVDVGEYYNEWKDSQQAIEPIIRKDPKGQSMYPYWDADLSVLVDGYLFATLDKKPNVKGLKSSTDKGVSKMQVDLFMSNFDKELTEKATLVGAFKRERGDKNDEDVEIDPLVIAHVTHGYHNNKKDAFFPVQRVDALRTLYPDSELKVSKDGTMLGFYKGLKLVGAVMHIEKVELTDYHKARIEEIAAEKEGREPKAKAADTKVETKPVVAEAAKLPVAEVTSQQPSEQAKPVTGRTRWFVDYSETNKERTTETKSFATLAEAREFAKGKSGYISKQEDAGSGLSTDATTNTFKEYFGGFDPSAQEGQKMKAAFGAVPAAELPVAEESPQKDAAKQDAATTDKHAKAEAVKGKIDAKPKSILDRHGDVIVSAQNGDVDIDQFKAAFTELLENEVEVKAELNALKKDEILSRLSGMFAYRLKNEKKQVIVDAAYDAMLRNFALGRSYGPSSYVLSGPDSTKKYEQAKIDALKEVVANTTMDDINAYSEKFKEDRKEVVERIKARAESVENPKTLEDFRSYFNYHSEEGKSVEDARMMLTPEQRAEFDRLMSEHLQSKRTRDKDADRTSVSAAGQQTGGEIIATKHTQKGHDLFVVKLDERVSREDYLTLLSGAKKLGGYYSKFRGNGAIPGFQFTTRESAQAFLSLAKGDATTAQVAVQERRDAFEDDRSQTAAQRLTAMADRLEEQAEEIQAADRKANTARRARFAAAADENGRRLAALGQTMRNLAKAIEGGTAQFLGMVRTKTQVEMLANDLRTAKYEELRAKYPAYIDQERRKGEPPTGETADYATFPQYTLYRSDWATLGRQLLEHDGFKKLGERIMRVADDVSDAYLKFAKENTLRLGMVFRKKDGSLATFASKAQAEAAIRRSGHRGNAIPFQVKRGEHMVIPSPSYAMNIGLWQGDGDKKITLSPELVDELVAKLGGRMAKRDMGLPVPRQIENAHTKRKALARMGIESAYEYRAALREFVSLAVAPAKADKIKELERAMVGRVNDGLDFFPTPQTVADEMVSVAGIEPGMTVLEPSAGMGHIAERIRAAGVEPDVVEMSNSRRELLEEKGFNVISNDFLDMNPRGFTYGDVFRDKDGTEGVMRGSGGMGSGRVGFIPLGKDERQMEWKDREDLEGVRKSGTNSGYDRIIMNPPFSERRDIAHVRHAYDLLRTGGRLVAIMGEGSFFGQDKKAQEFREWLDSVGGTSEKLPDGSFQDTSLPVNTGVNARMVVIEKEVGAQYQTTTSTPTTVDIRAAFPWADSIVEHDGKTIVTKGKVSFAVEQVDSIGADRIAFRIGYGRGLGQNEAISGAYLKGKATIQLSRVADQWTVQHEFEHFLEDMGLITSFEQAVLDAAVKRAEKDGTLKIDPGAGNGRLKPAELRAYFVQHELAARDFQRKTTLGRVLQKVADFVDALVNLVVLTSRGVVRGVENGKMMGREGVGSGVNWQQYQSVATAGASPDEIADAAEKWRTMGVDSPYFKKWFGDSKVVDGDGKPLIVNGLYVVADKIPELPQGWKTGKKLREEILNEGKGIDPSDDNAVLSAAWNKDSQLVYEWTSVGPSSPAEIAFFYAGLYGANRPELAVGRRRGEIPKSGRSKNHATGEYEKGVSAINLVNTENQFETRWYDATLADKNDNLILGYVPDTEKIYGSDGEPMFVNAVKIGETKDYASLVKSVDNRGTFSTTDPRIQYQVAAVTKSRQFMSDLMDRPETFGPFKALNTQLHKARKSPAFRKLFERIHAASGTQTRSAARAAELAPDILPDYGSGFKATVKELFTSGKYTAQDMAEASKVLSICTLSGKTASPMDGHRLTDDEIASLERGEAVTVGANDVTMTKKQVELYRQARAALDQMVNEMATSQAWRAMRGVITNEDIRENGWQLFADNPVEIPAAMARVLAAELNKAQARKTQAEQAAHAFANVDDMAAFAEHGRKLKKLVNAQKNADKFSQKQLEGGDLDEIIAKREEKIQRMADELGIDPDDAKDSLAEFVKLAKEFKAAESHVGAVTDAQVETERIFGEAKKLVDAGYAPLSRFGKYRINVHDADGNLIYVSMYDTSTEANMQRRKMVESFKGIDGAVVGPVRDMPQETWRLYQGQNPEALMLFAKNAGADAEAALQTYYQEALSSRSALKRLIKRQGFAGYSTDLQRIVASFVTSGAKRVGANYHADDIMEIMGDLDAKAKAGEVSGDVADEAENLRRFVNDPGDAGSGFRSFAANWYMLGSMMSAAWNGTQVISSSIPELYKYNGSIAKTAKEVLRAYRSMAKNGADLTAREKSAVKTASQDGTIDSAEIHHLYGMATKRMINNLGGGEAAKRAGAFLRLWGMPFAWFETVNRKATFLAAFRQGEAMGVDDPYAFAKDIVDVTQGIYSKTNRPNVARSTAGGAVLTFMQYKIMTLEQISRNMKEGGQARKAAALQLAIIASLGGWAALPFAENLMDLFDAIMQIMGKKAWLTKKKLREAIESGSKSAAGALLEKEAANAVGQFVADFANTGISAALPVDVSGRASMGEIVPGVKLLKPSTQFRDSEIFAMAGVPGSMIESLVDASSYAMRGDVGRAAKRLAPNAVAAAVKGVDIIATGEIRNASGKKIADGDAIDGALQIIGAQPKEKTRIGVRVRENQELKFLAQQEEKSIIKEWADAYEEKGSKARTEAMDGVRARLRDWNARNPEWRIAIKQSQVLRELQNRRKTVAELAVKSAPKELRQSMGVQ